MGTHSKPSRKVYAISRPVSPPRSQMSGDNAHANNGACECCLKLVGLGGVIAYLVYGIKFLVHDYAVCDACAKSALWAYALVNVILSLGSFTAARNNNNNDDDASSEPHPVGAIVCCVLVYGGLAAWGAVELFVRACDDVRSAKIWTFALVTFAIQCFAVFFALVCLPLASCVIVAAANARARVSESEGVV